MRRGIIGPIRNGLTISHLRVPTGGEQAGLTASHLKPTPASAPTSTPPKPPGSSSK